MDKFALGLLLGGLLGVGGLYAWQTQAVVQPCAGACGEGTACVDERCEVVVVQEAQAPEEEKKGKKRRRKRGKRGGDSQASATTVARVNDSHVPRYDRKKAKMIGEGTGSERLNDTTVNRVLNKLDPKFQACIAKAAAATQGDLASGRVSYEFGIAPSGKVTGVNVRAPEHLKALGVDACVRVAVFGASFPSFDGIDMGAEGSFSI